MSDYISKSAVVEELKMQKDDNDISCRLCMDTMIEIVEEQPTISETEIIRKAFERVVERLEDDKNHLTYGGFPFKEPPIYVKDVIEIIKEEGGIECMK